MRALTVPMESAFLILLPIGLILSWVSFGLFEAEGGVQALDEIKSPILRACFWLYLHGTNGRRRVFDNEGLKVIFFPLLCISWCAQSIASNSTSKIIYSVCGIIWLAIIFVGAQ